MNGAGLGNLADELAKMAPATMRCDNLPPAIVAKVEQAKNDRSLAGSMGDQSCLGQKPALKVKRCAFDDHARDKKCCVCCGSTAKGFDVLAMLRPCMSRPHAGAVIGLKPLGKDHGQTNAMARQGGQRWDIAESRLFGFGVADIVLRAGQEIRNATTNLWDDGFRRQFAQAQDWAFEGRNAWMGGSLAGGFHDVFLAR
jgi:hypothetical protein